MAQRTIAGALVAGILVTIFFTATEISRAEEESTEAMKPKHCVTLWSIDRTEVVDDHNILFHMAGGKIYRNQLPHRCPGLKTADSFMYRTSLSQLCDLDVITVLHNIGIGFMRGPSCGLGSFQPITEDEVALLKEGEVAPDEGAVTPEVESVED